MSSELTAVLRSADIVDDRAVDPQPLGGIRVTLFSGLDELASAESRAEEGGHFRLLGYRRGSDRKLTLVFHDIAGREIRVAALHNVSPRFKVLKSGRVDFEDIDDDAIVTGDFIVNRNEALGFLVTLGTGNTPNTWGPGEMGAPPGPNVPSGWGLSRGNAVTVLTDHEVFAHAASRMRDTASTATPRSSIILSQHTFSLPVAFDVDPAVESPAAIFAFDPPPPALNNLPRPARAEDARPERLLIAASRLEADVRVLLDAQRLPFLLRIILAVFAFPVAGSDGIFATGGILDRYTSVDEARRYFTAAPLQLKVQDFQQSFFNFGIMHARLAVFDGLHAICMGASFTQSYIDTHDHAIDAPRRGGATGLPNHDVGIGLTGPAVGDFHRNLALLWNNTDSPDKLEPLEANPPMQPPGAGDALCSIQVVRTLTKDRFTRTDPDLKQGEKGCLEAYLRAIANAEDFIYLENQYFIDCRIADALVNVMKKKRGRPGRPDLQVILVLNIKPDVGVLFYPIRQRRLITGIRRAIGETPDAPRQFAVFTRWTHEMGQPRPRIMPVYLHTKVGIVDDVWATVGSANLDYASMDRAVEVNALLLNGVDGQPASEAVDILRRKLWAEHLGFVDAQGAIDPNASELQRHPSGQDDWLGLWRERARATLEQLRAHPAQSTARMARVLPWPSDNTTHKEPRDYLTALGIRSDAVVPIKGTRAFDFKTGDWKPGSKVAMDYD